MKLGNKRAFFALGLGPIFGPNIGPKNAVGKSLYWNISHTVKGSYVMVFNATFNNISVILWQSVLLVEETIVPGENC